MDGRHRVDNQSKHMLSTVFSLEFPQSVVGGNLLVGVRSKLHLPDLWKLLVLKAELA